MGMIRPGCLKIKRLAQDFVLTDISAKSKIVIVKSKSSNQVYSICGSRVKGVKVVQGRSNQDKSIYVITEPYSLTRDFYVIKGR